MKRTLIIGDIHGCFEELLDLFEAAGLSEGDRVVSVGDLVDRGPKPAEVVRWFRERPGSVVLMGNHERKHVRGVYSYSQEITRLQFGDHYAEVVDWMRDLPYYYEVPSADGSGVDAVVVHAALIPGLPLTEQDESVLAGTTAGEKKLRAIFGEDRAWHEAYDGVAPVAFGHHVTGAPLVREGKVYGIDTGCCHGHTLTALSVPDFKLFSVPARHGDYWARAMRDYQVPVLRTRDWAGMSWAKIRERLDEHRDHATDDTKQYIADLDAWVDGVKRLPPLMHERVPVIYDELPMAPDDRSSAIQAHPARPLLYLHERGRLTLDAVESRCGTPSSTLDLARKLGLDTAHFVLP